jgi:hypothetical protein
MTQASFERPVQRRLPAPVPSATPAEITHGRQPGVAVPAGLNLVWAPDRYHAARPCRTAPITPTRLGSTTLMVA